MNFFRSIAVRESIESIVVAIVLAFVFKTFEAEAYIIPTGSMAPTLRGEHFDVACPQCANRYQSGWLEGRPIYKVFCPMCGQPLSLRANEVDHRPFDGDRILVNKFIYDFAEPNRWDVIVFKNPKNAKQNYIKRLCGLPNEAVSIEFGDLYTYQAATESFQQRKVAKKPPGKIAAMHQLVYDSRYVGKSLMKVGWPSRFQDWELRGSSGWQIEPQEDHYTYAFQPGSDTALQWLRYRHLLPGDVDWEDFLKRSQLPPRITALEKGESPGTGPITDSYAYNEAIDRMRVDRYSHWVGDVGIECLVEVESDAGTLAVETAEGGARFMVSIDVATGRATLSCSRDTVQFLGPDGKPAGESLQGQTSLRGAGSYRLKLMNADDRLFLWINGRSVEFQGQPFVDFTRSDPVRLKYSAQDPGDLEPVGIGAAGVKLSVSRIKVWRDVYYVSVSVRNGIEYRGVAAGKVAQILGDPRRWETPEAAEVFDRQTRTAADIRVFGPDQFFPMGDNSPSSLDARLWPEPAFVKRSQLLGRALFVFFPHTWNKPIPFLPDFSRMKFIR